MNLKCTILHNGGNNFMEKVKEKNKKEYSQQELTLQQIYTQWDNIYKKEEETYLKQLYQ